MNWAAILVGSIVLGLLLAGPVAGIGTSTIPADHGGVYGSSEGKYAVQQGDRCYEITPLGDGGTDVESFYSYRHSGTEIRADSFTAYSSYGTVRLQENQVSSVFLYAGSGGVSLVFLHDRHGIDSPQHAPHGGAVSIDIRGMPPGEWVIRDDYYDGGAQSDRWTSHGNTTGSIRVDWIWRDGRTDGGVYRGLQRLGPAESVLVTPTFNEGAGLWEADLANTSDIVRRWQLLDGDGRHITLSMSEPIAIHRGSCSDLRVERIGLMGFRMATNGDQPVRNVTRYLPSTAPGDYAGVQLSKVDLRLREGDPSFSVTTRLESSKPQSLPPAEGVTDGLLYATMHQDGLDDRQIDAVTVQFDVARSVLEARGLGPEGVAVLQYRNGSWHKLSSELAFRTADAYVVEASTSTVAPVVLGTREPDVEVVNVTPTASTIVRGDKAIVRARIVNDGLAVATVPIEFTVQGQVVERRNVTVTAGTSQTVEFTRQLNRTGGWELGVNGRSTTVRVEPPSPRLAVLEIRVEPSSVAVGEQISIISTVRNVGGAAGTEQVFLSAFGTTVATRQVTLEPGETEQVRFVRSIEAPGTYTFRVGDERVEVTVAGVSETSTSVPPSDRGSFGAVSIALGMLLLLIGLGGAVLLWR